MHGNDIIDDEALLYERLRTSPGIKLEIVTGGAGRSRRVFELLARQVWCENAREGYRAIDHTDSGAPLLIGDDAGSQRQRISVSHTDGLFAVATLPPAAEEVNLEVFKPETALGVDVERADRNKVLDVRERFLNEEELKMIQSDDLRDNIIAWTCKEAMLKLTFNTKADIRNDLRIKAIPRLDNTPGKGIAILPGGQEINVELYSMSLSKGRFILTLSYTPETLRFGSPQS